MAVATVVLLLLVAVTCQSQPEESGPRAPEHDDAALAKLEREGRDQYQQAVQRISMPQSGTCWKQAVAALQEGCRQLDEETHGELALRFSDCFLEMSGLERHNCQFEDKACLREMNQTAFDTYSKFYIHTQSMCYFLYNQAWHQETEKTIARLTTTSSKMSQQLEESAEVQGKMLSDLLLVNTVVGQVSTLLVGVHSLLLSGSSFFGTVLFFTVAAVAVAAVARTRSASSVVPHMFAVLFAGAIAETVTAKWLVADAQTHFQQVWFLRCFEAVLCTVLLMYAAWRYTRYGPVNNALLKMVETKVERVLVAVLNINKAKEVSQSKCVKCARDNGTHLDIAYHNIKEKSLPRMYENTKREETKDKQSILSQSTRGSFLLQRSPVAVATRLATTDFSGPFDTNYSRPTGVTLGGSYLRTSDSPRRSPTPFVDARQAPSPPTPPPPYDYAGSKTKTSEDTTVPLTRRDFYTPERETGSSMDLKKAVVRIEPLKSVADAQASQPPRRPTPTRKVRQARSSSERGVAQSGSEYSLRSHNRDASSNA